MTDGPMGLTQLLQKLASGAEGKGIKIITPFDMKPAMPDNDGPHIVTRGEEECEGEADDEHIHRLAHFLMDKFGWFERVAVSKAGGAYWVEVIHSYPPAVDIDSYTRSWAEGALSNVPLPLNWKFMEKSNERM